LSGLQGLAEVRAKLEAIGEATNGTAAEFLQEVSAAKRSLEESRAALAGNVDAVRDLSKELRTSLGQTVSALQHSTAALQRFDSASGAVGNASQQISGAVGTFGHWMKNEEVLLARQRELAEKVLPQLLQQFVGELDAQSGRLRATWSSLAGDVERTVKGASGELTSNVESLVEQVDRLTAAIEKAQGSSR
jgi:ABC-type transporter Mla subunit MlaD